MLQHPPVYDSNDEAPGGKKKERVETEFLRHRMEI